MKTKMTSLKVVSLGFVMILFLFTSKLTAQIIYTDIPDATPNATYSLDLNNDTTIDFIIQFDLGDKVMCKPQNNNAYSGNFVGGVHLPWAISVSTSICDTLATWYDAKTPGTMAYGTSLGYWVGETNKYLALKLIVDTNTYYGWLRLDLLANSTSFTIKDYAYQSTPNTCILSGQTTTGMKDNQGSIIFSIFPNPFTSTTTIQTPYTLKNASLTTYNAFGQALKQVNGISGQTISLSRDNLPSGLYFVRLTEENRILATEKILLTD